MTDGSDPGALGRYVPDGVAPRSVAYETGDSDSPNGPGDGVTGDVTHTPTPEPPASSRSSVVSKVLPSPRL